MKKIYLFLMMVVTALALSCGGGEGDDIVTPPNQGNNNGNGQNNNSGETEYVQVKCYACYGSTKCQTCNGTGKGCKDCHGTGQSCDYCNATGKCYKCNGDRNCIDCRGTGDRTCNICYGSGECQNCYKGQCKACNGKGWYYGYTFEVINCTSCYTPGNNYRKGDGKCRSCRGTDKCSKNCKNGKLDCNRCSGTGKCDDCSGTGTCRKCKGTPTCKTCNGDGHCTDCKNSDGKCTVCEGTGYTKEKKGTPNPEDEFVLFSSNSIELTAGGEPQTITVTANIEWKIISNTASSWLTVSKIDEKTLQLTAAENTTKEARSGTVTIKGRAKSAELTVTQAKAKDFLTVSENTVELLPEGETKYITVSTNLEGWYIWHNDASSWLEASTTQEGLVLRASRNNTGQTRQGTVSIGGINYDGGLIRINITQAAYKNPDAVSIYANGVSFNMILVEGGTFTMGLRSEFEKETKTVTVNSFYIGETEVTQALWYAIMGKSPTADAEWQWNSELGLGDNYPVYYADFDDCQEFITKLNQLTGKNFRFPAEAEWEFAACGGNKSKGYMYAGSNNIDDVAWYSKNSDKKAHEVAQKQPNELGLYDMTGNVHEWCGEWFSYNSRTMRGGSWESPNTLSANSSSVGGIVGSREYAKDRGLRLVMD